MSRDSFWPQCRVLPRTERQRGHDHRHSPEAKPARPGRDHRQRNGNRGVQAAQHQVRDRDSLGLFQQRPSQGWGTPAQVLDPVYATNKFYDALVKVDNYQTLEITKVAQAVQKSAFPEAYAERENEGRILASTLTGHSPGGLGCRLDGSNSQHICRERGKAAQLGVGVASTGRGKLVQVTGRDSVQAWAAGSWAVAHAEVEGITAITVGDRAWTRARGEEAWSWQNATKPLAPTTVAITLH